MALAQRVVLSLLVCLPQIAAAQVPAHLASVQIPITYEFAAIRPGQTMRWTEAGGRRFEGKFEGRTDSTVLVRSLDHSRSVRRASIDTVWTRGNSARPGAAIGGLMVGAVFAFGAHGLAT